MASTLAYYDTTTITAIKSFIVQAPRLMVSTRVTRMGDFSPIRLLTFCGLIEIF